MLTAQKRFRTILLEVFAALFLFTGCLEKVNPGTEKENDMYDGPDKAARFEFEKTKDPATGKVPRERLLTALDQTLLSRQTMRGNPGLSLPLLSWTERGANSDVVGPSNGNSRANGGVTAGRIRAIMVDSADATHKTVWAGGIDGGLWKTTDITTSPANWVLVNDFLSNLAVAAICQDPTDFNTMYFCTGESYFNADAVAGVGVFKSTDHGVTWNYLPSTAAFTRCTRILCDFQGNIYLATRANGVLRSTKASGGVVWTPITPNTAPNFDICDMEISSTSAPGRLHIVTGIFSTQAYRYTDIPATVSPAAGWNSPVTAFPSFNARAEIAVMGNTLYAAPANDYPSSQVLFIYKSTDGGANWAATAGQPSAGWANGQGWYSLSVVINPADPNQCIVGGLDNYKTTNGGASWTQISAWVGLGGQYVHADQHHALWWAGGTKLIFACDGGIHYSSDGGTTIRDRNIGLRLKQFYSVAIHPSTTNYFLAGAQDNGTHQLTNPGLGGSVEVTGGDGAFVAIDQDQPQYQFGAYVYNQYRRSTDGGASWGSVNFSTSIGRFINPWDYDNSGNLLYAAYSPGQYLRWNDPQTGSTTSLLSIADFNGAIVSTVSVSPYTANRVYFGTGNSSGITTGGRIVRVDAANTGVPTSVNITGAGMPAGGFVSCVATGTNDQNLMASFSNYGINNVWVTTNGGTSWTAVDGNLPDMPVRWCLFYPGDNTKAYIATETGVWETDLLNGGSTVWTSDPTFPTVRTDMIKYRPSDRTIAAGTHGRGVWTATVPNGCTPPSISSQPSNSSICEGANTSFSVTATGTAPLTYQWQVSTDAGVSYSPLANGGVYSNVTTATMNITGATVGMNNYRYRCVVTGQCAPPATSNGAILTVGANASAGVVSGTSPLCIGATTTYTRSGTGGGTWSSSAPGVATVNPSTGLVAAVSAGTSTITYTVSGCGGPLSASKVLTVNPNVSAGTVSGTSPLCIGATDTYTSNGTGGGTWSSSSPGVATVNSISGLVTGVSAGTATITYTVGGCNGPVSASKVVTVSPTANAGTVSGTSPLCIGANTTYTSSGDPGGTWSSSSTGVATVNPTTGLVHAVSAGTTTITYTVGGCGGPLLASQVLTVSPNANAGTVSGTSPLCVIGGSTTYTTNGDPEGTWSSSAPAIATVDPVTGLVTAVSPGSSTITYAVSSGCNAPVFATKIVTVNPTANAGTVSGASLLCIGATSTYTSNGDPGGTWSSDAPGTASVDPGTGLVTAVSAGTATITYTVMGCSGSASASKLLTVNPNVSAGTVSGTSPLCIGATDTYTSSGTGGGTWSSSAPGVANVNSGTGLVTAVSAGMTTITYTVSSGCGAPVTASKVLTVSPNANAGIISGISPLCIGGTDTYTSSGTGGGTWSSSAPGVATVNSISGLVTGVSAGTATITYTVGGCNGPISASKVVTVSPTANAGTVSGTSPLCIGANSTYTSNGDPGGTWSSSLPGVATVNSTTGLVHAVSGGTTTITYTVGGCGGPVSASQLLTVNPNAIAGIVSGTSPLCIGAMDTYTSNGDAGGTWSSNLPGIATVDPGTGLVTAVNAGTAIITYTVSSGCNAPVNASKTLTVNPNVNAGSVSGTSPLCVGAATTYTSNGNPGGSWSSSAPGVATVNSSTGLVTAAGPGTATITYTVNGCNGPANASKLVTVNPLPQGSLSANGPFVGSGTGMLTWTATAGTDPFTVVYNDGTANCTALGVMSGVAFNVFTNPVTSTTTYSLVSVSDVNCTRSSAFTDGSATITVTGGTCTGYMILGLKDVNLGESNTVNGDIGNNTAGKKVDIDRHSTVNGLIRASVIILHPPVTVTGGLFYSPAGVILPPMLLNTAVVPGGNFSVPDNGIATINTNYNTLTIGKNAVVTINGTIYGTITIREAATVTFTAGDINIDQLTSNDGRAAPLKYTTILFANDASVRIKNKVDLGARNRINESSSKRVTFYLGDLSQTAEQFNVNGTDTRVKAGIYLPKGKLDITNNGPCTMTGTIISENITSNKNVTWNCGYAIPAPDLLTTGVNNPNLEFSVKVFPNPSVGEFRIQVNSNSSEPVTIRLIDATGKNIRTITSPVSKNAVISIDGDLRGGVYIAQVKQGDHVQTLKLVKLN